MRRFFIIMMVVAQLLWLCAGRAGAGPIYFEGNDCAGVFGQSFASCNIDGSPIIAKWDAGGTWEFNTDVFPDLRADMWTLSPGSWHYDGTGPAIQHFVVKAGPGFYLYDTFGATDWTYTTPLNKNGNPLGVSHLSFYDTAQPVPEPGSMLMFGTGMLFLGNRIRKWGIRK